MSLAGCDRLSPPSAGCRVAGIDVSRHQGDIDWAAVARSGIAFAWIKATEGGDWRDPAFRRNWYGAKAAGVRHGAYHFATWCRPAAEQAAWFVANVPDDPDALPPVLDVEWNPQSRSCPNKVPRATAVATMNVLLDAMRRAYGREPLIYAPADFFRDVLDGAFVGHPLWVRGLEGQPASAYGARSWVIWQHSETGTVSGIEGGVDRDCAGAMIWARLAAP